MRGWLRRLESSRVVIHTQDDRSIRGVLVGVWPDCLVLTAPEYLGEAQPASLSGDAVVPRSNVSWLQRLTEN